MIYVEAPASYTGTAPALFLAGGITGVEDWQTKAVEEFHDDEFAVLNPRRRHYPAGEESAGRVQVRWEFEHLTIAAVVLFWFPRGRGSVQPIALYELGRWAALGKQLIVGCDPGYERRWDVIEQLGHARPEIPVFGGLPAVCSQAREMIAQVSGSAP